MFVDHWKGSNREGTLRDVMSTSSCIQSIPGSHISGMCSLKDQSCPEEKGRRQVPRRGDSYGIILSLTAFADAFYFGLTSSSVCSSCQARSSSGGHDVLSLYTTLHN